MADVLIALMGAGLGRRFGGAKLEHPLADGRPLIQHSAEIYAGLGPRLLCLRPGDARLKALAGEVVEACLEVADAERGLSASIGAAAAAAEREGAAALLIALGDMPFVCAEVAASLCARARALAGQPFIVAPAQPAAGQLGHPVIFSAHFFAGLQQLQGDRGAKPLIEAERQYLHTLPSEHPGCYWDIDRPQDLAGPV